MFFLEGNQRNKTLYSLRTSLRVLKMKMFMKTQIISGERISRKLNQYQQLRLLIFLCILALLKTGCLQKNFLMREWRHNWNLKGKVNERQLLRMLFKRNSNYQKVIKSKSQVNKNQTIRLTWNQQEWWNNKNKKIVKWMEIWILLYLKNNLRSKTICFKNMLKTCLTSSNINSQFQTQCQFKNTIFLMRSLLRKSLFLW